MILVDTFCIDAFEASLAEASPFHPPTGTPRAVSLRGAVPQAHISQVQAAAACAEAGKRLCTDDEWLRACRGPSDTQYPYGPTRMPGVCNDARGTHPAVELYGTAASWVFSHLDSPCFNQLADSLARTAEKSGCVTAEGAFDMMGNLHEWTADPAGTFRGGFYVDTMLNGEGCAYRTTAHDVSYSDYSTGFRCCASPVVD
jgi:formylglycine-generating enzyme required for sulfatase activity